MGGFLFYANNPRTSSMQTTLVPGNHRLFYPRHFSFYPRHFSFYPRHFFFYPRHVHRARQFHVGDTANLRTPPS